MLPIITWPGSSGISAAATTPTRSPRPSACATQPDVLLIGPDGRIVAKDLQGDQIKQAVAEALAKK